MKSPVTVAIVDDDAFVRSALVSYVSATPGFQLVHQCTNGAEAVEAVYAETGHALAHGDYVDALAHLARLRPQVDAFFDAVMVNVEDTALRRNRLALLKRLADRLGSVAAIEHLSA